MNDQTVAFAVTRDDGQGRLWVRGAGRLDSNRTPPRPPQARLSRWASHCHQGERQGARVMAAGPLPRPGVQGPKVRVLENKHAAEDTQETLKKNSHDLGRGGSHPWGLPGVPP